MANGSPNGRRRQAGARHVDLSAAGLSDQEAREVQEKLEHELGMRCNGCGRRIQFGHKFTSIAPRDTRRPVLVMYACSRLDCDFALQCREGATSIEMIEFAWVDENGPDAPPSLWVQRRNAQMAREREAAAAENPADG